MPAVLARTSMAALVAVAVLGVAVPARAGDELDASYFIDGHALLIYGSVLAIGAVELALDPPDSPRLFGDGEGGAEHNGDTVPYWGVGALAGLAGVAVLAPDTDARWYHVKGMAESVATTLFLTDVAKLVFGRHRPDYVEGDPVTGDESGRRSFFSGHASLAVSSTLYMALYLNRHVFPGWKPEGQGLTWWELTTYASLGAVAVYVPLSRVMDNRHHPTDVLTGSLVGASMSTVFFLWQERRYQRDRAAERDSGVLVMPWIEPRGAGVLVRY